MVYNVPWAPLSPFEYGMVGSACTIFFLVGMFFAVPRLLKLLDDRIARIAGRPFHMSVPRIKIGEQEGGPSCCISEFGGSVCFELAYTSGEQLLFTVPASAIWYDRERFTFAGKFSGIVIPVPERIISQARALSEVSSAEPTASESD